MGLLKSILEGMATFQIFPTEERRPIYFPKTVSEALASDFRKVGEDISIALKRAYENNLYRE